MKYTLNLLLTGIAILFACSDVLADEYINPAPITSLEIPYIGDPVIDGVADVAYPAPFPFVNILTFSAGNFTGQSDHYINTQLGWGDKGLYFYFDVTDDIDKGSVLDWGMDGVEIKINPNKENDGPNFEWKDDAIEIGVVRGITDEYRYHIVDIDGEGTEGNGPGSNGDTVQIGQRKGLPGVEFAIINNVGNYKVEMLIPWMFFLPLGTESEDVATWREKEMGLDIHCHDNDISDTNGGRDHSLIWDADGDPNSTDADRANKNTSLLGNITFGASTSLRHLEVSPLDIYPNPASEYISVNSIDPTSHICVINSQGQSVKSVWAAEETVQINVADLSKGMYIVKCTNPQGSVAVSKVIID